MLLFFKYTNFLIENLNFILDSHLSLLKLTLPLAISFFTFQQIAFLVDAYKHQEKEQIVFLDYCLFVTFFPQLIAGPIVHHKEMMPQFHSILNNKTLIHWEHFTKGVFIFSMGLFKKAVIADQFAVWANNGFRIVESGKTLSFFESWLTSLSYTFQLYFDFSGYCDMAIGLGLFFGITLPINFNAPYRALNIKEFWKRWHMTLGRFLTAYLYIPLGGNKLGKIRELFNIFVVFFLSGIWHGAGWGFIIWGTLHALAMMIQRIYTWWADVVIPYRSQSALYKILCWTLTFGFVNFAWVFFRSENLEGAINLLKGMMGVREVVLPNNLTFLCVKQWILQNNIFISSLVGLAQMLFFYILGMAMIFWHNHSSNHQKYAFFYGCLFAISLSYLHQNYIFLYFNF